MVNFIINVELFESVFYAVMYGVSLQIELAKGANVE
jgi:hypothetical protein